MNTSKKDMSAKDFLQELAELLKSEPSFVSSDEHLLKNYVTERALALDPKLIKLLRKDKRTFERFFKKVDDIVIFDRDSFVRFLNLKDFLPDSYTAFEQKIGLATSNGGLLSKDESVVLNWPYKDCVLEGDMRREGEPRDEVFYNNTLAPDEVDRLLEPKVLTSFKRYDKKGEHSVTDFVRDGFGVIGDNIIIRGNNILALASIKQEFVGKVKLVYIDPPYNTDNDSFAYNDSFNHSTWLTFMRNRLMLAKELLTDNGSIYVQLDHNEIHYCKVLMDEIFGRDKFQREIIWHLNTAAGFKTIAKNWVRDHDSILFYSKGPEVVFHELYRDYSDEYKARFKKADKNGRKYRDDRGSGVRQYLDELKGIRVSDVWNDVMSFQQAATAKEYLKFAGQKPETLIQRIISASTNPGDLVLDFFGGTGTTAAVAQKMGRRYLLIEQIDSQVEKIVGRMKKVLKGDDEGISKEMGWTGGGSFVYCELKENNERFAKRIRFAESKDKLARIWKEMRDSAFLSYRIDPAVIDDHAKDFAELSLSDQKRFLDACLEKNHLYVNLSEIDDSEYAISDKEKGLNQKFYKTHFS